MDGSKKPAGLKKGLEDISGNLRRISYFAADYNWKKKSPSIKTFLNLSKEKISQVDEREIGAYTGIFLALKEELGKLCENWEKELEEEPRRKVWCEKILTASLRLSHLSKAL